MSSRDNDEGMDLSTMVARIQKYIPGDGWKLVEKAYLFAEKAHEGQFRKSGQPYFTHPKVVASILTELMIDPPTIAAGLLHDTVEDCKDKGITLETIRTEFGDEVAQMVDGVTKLERIKFANREEAQAESLRKMILAMSRDIRVVIIKLADRLHNMRTLKAQPRDRQLAIARETLDIYAPLAHRLGVYTIKQELEDLCLRYLDPEGYDDLTRKVGMRRAERQDSIRHIISELSAKLDEAGIHYNIDGRPKHFYSIYRKMVLQHKSFDQIYDLIAIRVVVETVPECYAVLGIVHTLWNQVPGRFKDYISVPKANMYQSLYTTVMGGREIPFPFEVQIRTEEMHRIAEYGIAAHWRYKEGGSKDKLDEKLYWVRQILDWSSDTRDSREFMDTLKTDLFAEEVLVFTPKADVISMPKGAVALDFAYAVHSGVGNHCVGAKINGRIVPLDTVLETGNMVEILTSSNAKGPSIDWIRICKTPQARAKIRQYLKKTLRETNVALGKSMLEHEAKHRGVNLGELMQPEHYEGILRKYGYQELDDIYAAVGYGGLTAVYVISRLVEEQRANEPAPPPEIVPQEEPPAGHVTHGIVLEGMDMDVPVRFAKCCGPMPGDDIVGFITRGRGVSVHKIDCPNAVNGERERMVAVTWADMEVGTFCGSIKVIGYDRIGLLGDVTSFISGLGVPIRFSTTSVGRNKIATIRLVLEVKSKEQMDSVIRQLQRRKDIIDVFRVTN